MSLIQFYKATHMDYASFLENFPKNTGRGMQREIVEYLEGIKETMVSVNATTPVGETGLFLALYEGMAQVADWFLSQGADPWLCPDLKAARARPQGCRVYVSSSPLHYAFKARMSMEFLHRLLEWNPKKSTEHIRGYTNEYTFKSLVESLVFRGWIWFHLSSVEIFERLRLLIEWNSDVSYEVYADILYQYYHKNDYDSTLTYDDIVAHLPMVANQYLKYDLAAVRIQWVWRRWRLQRAARIVQQHFRARIWNPEHIWANGQTTLERIFAGKTYGMVA